MSGVDITQLPLEELHEDLAASFCDIKVCNLALLHNIFTYGETGKSVVKRLSINEQIVVKINCELARRDKPDD